IVSVLDVAPHRISIVPSAVEWCFHPRAMNEVERVRARLSVGDTYFLYVGLAGVHKRVDWLVRRFVDAARDCPPRTQLLIVGGQGGEERTRRRGVDEKSGGREI